LATRLERLRKLRRLEAKTEGVSAAVAELEERRRGRVFEQALARLDTDELAALGPLVAAASSAGGSATVNLWEFAADQRDLKAIRSLARALDNVVVGKDLERGADHA
jgi:hypothetical protein